MRSFELDPTALTDVSLKHLYSYFLSLGWNDYAPPSTKNIFVMRKTIENQEEEIVIPRNQEFADFKLRLFEAVSSLSRLEHIEFNEILNDLLIADSDILRIRVTGSSVENGNIPFLDEIAIKEGLKKILASVACHVIDPKPFYKKLQKVEAETLIRACQTGQSEKGSYIIKIIFPPICATNINIPSESKKPFPRKVAEQLMVSLNEIINCVESKDTPIKSAHFSSNLCLSLAEMKPIESKLDFEFSISWSDEIPIDSQQPCRAKIYDRFLPKIAMIGEQMKPQREVTQSDFVGKITSLNGSENEQGLMEGEIILALLVDDESKKTKTYLNAEFYGLACDAHKRNSYIRVYGLFQEGLRISTLKDVSFFEIVPSQN